MNFEPGLIMDILAVVILLFSLIRGAQKGFVQTLLSFMQWFVCIIAGFFLCTRVKEYLIDHTNLDDAINSYILDQVGSAIEESTPYLAIPDLFSGWINDESSDFIYGTSASLTNVVMTVLSFVLIILVIKVVCWILVLLFSKEHNDGVIGFLDGFVGFLFGAVRGVLLLFVAFAILVPLLSLMPPALSDSIKTALDQSLVASILYDDNLLLILVRDLFS